MFLLCENEKKLIFFYIFAIMKNELPYDSIEFSLFIIAMANEEGYVMNTTKVQKLLYIAYGAYLSLFNNRIVNEQPRAWLYGPVFPKSRKYLSKLKNFMDIDLNDSRIKNIVSNNQMHDLVKFVFKWFGDWTASELIEWNNNPKSPYIQIQSINDFDWNYIIPDKLISIYFRKIIKKN